MSNIIVPYCHHIHHALKYDNEFIKEIENTKEILRRNLYNNNMSKTDNKTDNKTNQSIESSSQKDTVILPNEIIMNNIISYCTVDILNNISLIGMTWNTFIKSSRVDSIWNINCINDYNTSFTAFRDANQNPNSPRNPRELYINLSQSFQRLKREWFGSIKKPNLVIPML